MAHTADETTADALPDPEMNPLQNPLLAANMGRWAEVYFTTPPERRAEAVAELVRELQKSPPGNEEHENIPRADAEPDDEIRAAQSKTLPVNDTDYFQSEPMATESRTSESGGTESEYMNAVAEEVQVPCQICGHENSPAQKFCGMCGMQLDALQSGEQSEPEQMPRSAPEFQGAISPYEASTPSFLGLNQRELDQHENDEIRFETRREEAERIWSRPEPSLPSFAVDEQEVPHRHRVYLAIAVAALLSALLVMAWRSTKTWSGRSDVTTLPAAQPVPTAGSPANSDAVPAASASSPAPVPAAAAAEKDIPVTKHAVTKHAVTRQPVTREPVVKHFTAARKPPTPPPAVTDPSGQQDYETAEKFLGTAGGRNSGEAATYLWRAVGKGNAAATITLSDMYLRGDGVAKNCDQARLLLDAAARKGQKGAAERLRNLQAFGCQ